MEIEYVWEGEMSSSAEADREYLICSKAARVCLNPKQLSLKSQNTFLRFLVRKQKLCLHSLCLRKQHVCKKKMKYVHFISQHIQVLVCPY